MKRIRVGMIGAGVHSTNMLYPCFNHLPGIYEKVAVCDLNEEKAKFAAKEFGFDKTYTNYKEMIDRAGLNGVIISINAKEHPNIIINCLNMGVDVLVEKPIAVTVEEALKIEEAVEKTKKIVMVDHQKRYSIAYTKAMDLLKNPEFGKLVMIESKMHGRPYVTMFNGFIEWQIHNIDIIRAFAGEVKNVIARQNMISDNRAAIAVMLEFENGIVGTTHWGTEGGFGRYCERVELVCDNWKGIIVENARDVIVYEHNQGKVWRPDWQPIHNNFTHTLDGYVGIIKKFAECIATRENGKPNATDERKNLEIIHEIRKQLNIPLEWKYTSSEF